jgi:hypothetical protein
MTTVARRLVMAALLLGCAQVAFAQTANEIIEKHLAAIGGRAALGKLTSRTMTGTITLSTPVGELSGPIELTSQKPNKSRTLIKMDLSSVGAGQMVFDQRFDGSTGYVLDSLQGNRDITGNQLENMKNSSFPSPLLDYKEMGATVELVGKEKVGDRDAFVLLYKPTSGSDSRQFIDAETFLQLKVMIKVDLPQVGELEQTVEFSDYREVDGVKVPFKVQSTSSVQNSTIVITKVEQNIKVDTALFSKPGAGM